MHSPERSPSSDIVFYSPKTLERRFNVHVKSEADARIVSLKLPAVQRMKTAHAHGLQPPQRRRARCALGYGTPPRGAHYRAGRRRTLSMDYDGPTAHVSFQTRQFVPEIGRSVSFREFSVLPRELIRPLSSFHVSNLTKCRTRFRFSQRTVLPGGQQLTTWLSELVLWRMPSPRPHARRALVPPPVLKI